MKRITITCDDGVATTLTQLLINQSFSFSVEPVPDSGNRDPMPLLREKGKRIAAFREAKENRGLMAILRAAPESEGSTFTSEDVEREAVAIGLKPTSASAGLSHARSNGYVAGTGKGRWVLTAKGLKARKSLLPSSEANGG